MLDDLRHLEHVGSPFFAIAIAKGLQAVSRPWLNKIFDDFKVRSDRHEVRQPDASAIEVASVGRMDKLMSVVADAQHEFALLLRRARTAGPLRIEQYQRYLSMQYHLTRGVQTYFMRAAAHRDLVRKKALRKFLFSFANEEEQHYLVAANDLTRMGLEILAEPFDVTLWHAWFRSIVDDHPFIRLGAACVLENLSGGEAKEDVKLVLGASFLNESNTKFLVLHQHEKLPHGDQIVAALGAADLNEMQLGDLVLGAKQGLILYLRMAEWALFPESWVGRLDSRLNAELGQSEIDDIDRLDMKELMQGPA